MSLLTAISHSLTGLRAIQSDMQVISSNVSNAQREDYTRKSIILSSNTASVNGTGGVSVIGYGRAEAANIDRLLRQSLADDGLRSTQDDYLSRLQTLLGSSNDTPLITTTMSAFAAAWRDLATAPEDSTRQQSVVFKAQNLVREVNRLAAGLDKIKADAKGDVTTAVGTLNASLRRIEELNNEIVTSSSSGQSVGDLMDLRDVEVRKISGLMKVEVFEREQGRISLYTPNGYSLLDVTANQFSWNGSVISLTSDGSDVTGLLKGGQIEGYIGLLDETGGAAVLNDPGKASIYKLEQQLDRIVTLFTSGAGTFATAYDSAATATGEEAAGFFVGTTRYSFALEPNLVNGTTKVKQAAAEGVANDMDLENRTVTAAGISVANTSYVGFTNAIVYTQNQNAKHVGDLATIYSAQRDDYKKRLQNEVGVNVDEEIVRLTQLQNNYSAISRVISTVQSMLELLDRLGG